MQAVRIVEIPDCRMVSSGVGMFGDENFTAFEAWFSSFPRPKDARDFAVKVDAGIEWLYMYEEGMCVPERFEIVDFKGGLYAVSTDIDRQTGYTAAILAQQSSFLAEIGFEPDPARRCMDNVITPPEAAQIMGFSQMDFYTPIRPVRQSSD